MDKKTLQRLRVYESFLVEQIKKQEASLGRLEKVDEKEQNLEVAQYREDYIEQVCQEIRAYKTVKFELYAQFPELKRKDRTARIVM